MKCSKDFDYLPKKFKRRVCSEIGDPRESLLAVCQESCLGELAVSQDWPIVMQPQYSHTGLLEAESH